VGQAVQAGSVDLGSIPKSYKPTPAEDAYTALGPMFKWVDIDPQEVAATCAQEDLQNKVVIVGRLAEWIVAVHRAMEVRQHTPFTVVEGGRNGKKPRA